MATLIVNVAVLGLAVAFTSPVSVVTVIVLLGMTVGLRRALGFIAGWVFAIAVIAAITVFVLHGQDFSSKKTTPSRVASAVELAIGCLLAIGSAVAYRRQRARAHTEAMPKWLDRLDRTHWGLALGVGALMLTYSLTIAAVVDILKANVSRPANVLAFLVFALTSLVTVAAPVVIFLVAPERSAETLGRWRVWLVGNSRSVVLVVLMIIGVLLAVRGVYDLTA